MKPVIPTAKRSTGFTIDSLIGPQSQVKTVSSKTITSSSLTQPQRSLPHSLGNMGLAPRVPPPHPGLPLNLKGVFPEAAMNHELMALRSAWGLMAPQIETMQHFAHGQIMPNPLQINNAFLNGHRDPSVHLYPLLMARQNHCFTYPFSGSPDPSLMFHPYRKPKRIRTAFSPTQLLKLEDAFEKNHYVVGQERKDLATKLGLTETQVKVWFQNRRTKCKRVKSEDDDDNPSNQSTSQSLSDKSDDENDIEEMTSQAESVTDDEKNNDRAGAAEVVNVT
ncbi:hypothetical protein SNE40_017624 [Patella caerulea]|uniref:Homeobox domain-containing protein n=1 Tax=Patella caerulea TaxID=87958 RepID=A0AAN8JHF0_PATCE